MADNPFKKAVRHEAMLRLLLSGPTGSGKTFTALELACGIGDRVAVIDTERGSAAKYGHKFSFDVVSVPPPYTPERYLALIDAAGGAGYDVLVIDSLTHVWAGAGGLLEQKDAKASAMTNRNDWTAWKDVTPKYNKLVDGILAAPLHVIGTVRSKMAYEQVVRDNGQKAIEALGQRPVMRDDMEYEFDVHGQLDAEHKLTIHKSRYEEIAGLIVSRPGREFALTLKAAMAGAPDPSRDPRWLAFKGLVAGKGGQSAVRQALAEAIQGDGDAGGLVAYLDGNPEQTADTVAARVLAALAARQGGQG